jgi:hypothetical protein
MFLLLQQEKAFCVRIEYNIEEIPRLLLSHPKRNFVEVVTPRK